MEDTFERSNKGGQVLDIDINRILYRAMRYWYWLVLALIICLTIAYLRNRYAVRIYPITASIIIKESEETSEGKLLYNNPLVRNYRNYLNELYIIRSYPLVERTLKELNFGAAFYREGNIKTTEAYGEIPFRARVLNDDGSTSHRVNFQVLSKDQYKLNATDAEKESEKIFRFNDTITFEGLKAVFTFEEGRLVEAYEKVPFLFSYQSPAYLTGSYVGRLRAAWAEEGAGVIDLSIDGSNPTKEMDFLAGLIKQYQAYDLEKKNLSASRTIDFITDQLSGISDSLHRVERQLERFKDKNVRTNLSDEAMRLYIRLESLEAQKVDMILRSNYYGYLTTYIKTSENLDKIILPSSVGIDDQILTGLISAMVDTQMQLKMTTKTENPLVSDARRKINEIKKDIIESVENQKSTDKIKQNYLDKQIRDLERQSGGLPLAERQLVSIQRNYSLLENLYIFLLQKKSEAAISKASTTTDIAVVNPPMQTGGPITPKPMNNYLFALLAGLGLPLLAFVMLELFNTRVQSREDVEKMTTIPFIGGVGHKRADTNQEVFKNPKSAIAESFRALRSNLNYFIGQREKAVFLVTSSISGEGKTFTSINLASVFALSGKKTLIVGADMRKPKLFGDFGLNNNTGLSTFLAGITGFDQSVQQTEYDTLDLVSAGPVPPNPSELLLTPRMQEFINEARKRYDYVIIDTPPLAIVTDAFVMAGLADHTLFLIRQNYTPKMMLRTIQDFYSSGKLTNISIVLNDIYKSGPGYGYGYGYSYGYGYGYGYGRKKNGYGYYSDDSELTKV